MNRFYVHPGGDMSQGLSGLSESFNMLGEIKRRKEQEQKEDDALKQATQEYAEMKQGALEAFLTKDPNKIAAAMIEYPEMSAALKQASAMSAGTEDEYRNALFAFNQHPSDENLDRIRAIRAEVGIPNPDGAAGSYSSDPKKYTDFTRTELAFRYPDEWKNIGAKDAKTTDVKNFERYVSLRETDKEQAALFGKQIGLFEDDKEKLPTTAMGQFIKMNPEADSGQLIEFSTKLDAAKEKSSETKEWAPSTLKKLINERQELIDSGAPLDHPDVIAYDNKISGTDIDIENLTDKEIDFWGANFNITGKMPAMGRGKQATKIRMAIAKSAARQALGADEHGVPDIPEKTPIEAAFQVIGTQSDTKAIQGSLNFLDKQLSSMGSFVRNMELQSEKLNDLSKDLKTFDASLMNIPLRYVRGRLVGSSLQSKYDMYLTEIEAEIGKLATGSTASVAELSATAQDKWAKIHDKNLSVRKMMELIEETNAAAKFRLLSVREELQLTRDRMRDRRERQAQKQTTGAIQEGTIIRSKYDPNVRKIFRNGQWEDIR